MMNRSAGVIAGVMLIALGAPQASATSIDIPIVINGPAGTPPPPQCSLSFNPPMATIPPSTPSGAAVSTIVATNCAGAPIFAPPYYDDGGLFAISGNQLVINPQGPGVASLAGTTQSATVISP